jgi:hypothetical protein
MKFEENIREYLTGDKFSNGLKVRLQNDRSSYTNRIKIIEDKVKGKKVVHIGCCDHIPLIQKKIEKNIWLHKRLDDSSNKLLGVDINREGIDYMKNNLGYDDVVCANLITDDIQEIYAEKWDYLVLGEILEHVDNPVQFLSSIKEKYVDKVDKIIITVPNAFFIVNLDHLENGVEVINSDHRFWFTPYTLAKVGTLSGLEFIDVELTHELKNKRGLKAKLLVLPYLRYKKKLNKLKNYPIYRDTIIMTFKI